MPSSAYWHPRAARLALPIAALTALCLPMAVQAQSPQSCDALVREMAETGSVTLTGVHFDFNRSNLRQDSLAALVEARNAVVSVGGNWTIEGHTDNRGSREYNQRLSEARASVVRSWLVAAGAPSESLSSQGFSLDRPIADNASEEGRARNRRVMIVGQADLTSTGVDAAEICAAQTSTASAEDTPAAITGWGGTGGREWLAYSSLSPSGRAAGAGQSFETVILPSGTPPEICEAMCREETGCAAWSFEPGGSYSVAEARCFRYGYTAELTIARQNGYEEDGGYFASGLKPDATNLTPESEEVADAIVADLAEIEALRAVVRINANETVAPESRMRVQLTGAVPPDQYPSLIEIADLGDYVFYWGASHSHQFIHDMSPAGSGELFAPTVPGHYTLRYVIEHPTAGRQTIIEQPLHVLGAGQ